MYSSSTPRGPPPRRRDWDYPPGDDYYDGPPPRRTRRRPPEDDYYDRGRRPPPGRRDYDDYYYAGGAGAMGGAAAYDDYDYYDRPPRPPRSRSRYPEDYPDEPRVRRVSRDRSRGDNGGRPKQRPTSKQKKDDGMSGKTIVAAIVAIFLVILLLLIYFAPTPEFQEVKDRLMNLEEDIPTTPFLREYPEGVEFEFDKNVVVSATGSFSYTIKVSSPMDLPYGPDLLQDVLSVVPSKAPTEGSPSPESTSNIMMVWEESLSGGSSSLTVDYHVKTKTKVWEMDGSQSDTVADINQSWKDAYNHDEWRIDQDGDGVLDPEDDLDGDGSWDFRIEPTNPAIAGLSAELTGGKTNVYDKVRAIYEYLISDEVLDYETVRGGGLPKACTTTLDELRGDCDDYSILFVSLCRAADIPARLHLGLLYDPGNSEWIGHGWSGVYIPLSTGGAFVGVVDVVNKQFLFRDPYRVTDWIDTGGHIIDGGESVENLDYYYYSFTYSGSGSKQTDEYQTVSYKPYGKVLVEMSDAEVTGNPSDDENGGGGFSSIPGFDAYIAISAVVAAIAIITLSRRR
jgi:hypothetical protein